MPAAALRALLTRSIDYAGLFPPAGLELEPALENHARYIRSGERWMLGAFILPVAKFDAAAAQLAQFDREFPLEISALGPKTEDPAAFQATVESAQRAIAMSNPFPPLPAQYERDSATIEFVFRLQ